MTVTSLPPDGAQKRYKASQENAAVEKVQLVEKQRLSIDESLRRKIEAGEILETGNQSKFGQMIRQYANERWSFANIMNAFKTGKDPKEYESIMYQREAIEDLFKWVDRGIEIGKQARQQLSVAEKEK